METQTVMIMEFLLARIAEDEAVARKAVIPAHDAPNAYKPHPELTRWRYADDGEVEVDYDDPGPYPDVIRVTQDGEGLTSAIWDYGMGHHIARHDPARVLAECEAKRRIVTLMGYVRESWENTHSGEGRVMWPDVNRREKMHALTILENLAAVYADHADYRDEWRP